ncbi:MAG: ATP-dependent helicase, partial [Agromyces sp.]
MVLEPDDVGGWNVVEPATPLDELVDGLNPEQREAVEYRGRALLIVAGAGSGKTRVLTHRIASLLATKDAWPSQILAITFTNKAAAEMRERVEQLLGAGAEGMWISTFHSACVRILRRQAEVVGLKSGFTIYDSADVKTVIKRIIKQLDADTMGFTPGGVAAKISKLKNELADADSYARTINLNDPQELMFLEIFRTYTRTLRAASALDFDDLIAETVYLFRAFPEVAALYRRRFRHILVDEYQETNHAQYALIRELTQPVDPIDVKKLADAGVTVAPLLDAEGRIPAASLAVVGDSDQSIYAFRGADIRNILEFERDYPGARVVLLEQNYRSTQTILSAANAVISNNFDRKAKNLWTADGAGDKIVGYTGYSGHDEAQFVADEIEALHRGGMDYRDIAVFYRTNAQTRALEEIFVRSAIPYRVVGGTKFYERAEIKDAMAYLIAIANPLDELALRRILNTPKRGIGPATETALASFAEANQISYRQAMRAAGGLGLGPKVTAAITDLADTLDEAAVMLIPTILSDGTAGPAAKVADVLTSVMQRSG